MNERDLRVIVHDAIGDALATDGEFSKRTLTQRLVLTHLDADDSDCARAAAWYAFGSLIRQGMKQFDKEAPESEPSQLVLDGFDLVQRAYLVERDGESRLVRTDLMTLAEGRAKAASLRSFAQGALKHADELDAYFDAREAAAE
jgi:hypothetical protein